jgi:integrase
MARKDAQKGTVAPPPKEIGGGEKKVAAYRFSTAQEARIAPPPLDNFKSPYVEHKHSGTPGLFVRVMKPDSQGRIRRLWVHRYKVNEPDGKGSFTKRDRKVSLGYVEVFDDSEHAMPLEEAMQRVLNTRAATRASRFEPGGGSPRLTLAAAMEYYDADNSTHRDATRVKDKLQFERYFRHFKHRYLDELNYAFWLKLQNDLLSSKVKVGEEERNGKTVPIYVGPIAAATMKGVINVAIMLYELAGKFEGLRNVEKGYNPPRRVKKNLKTPNKKTRHIPLNKLGQAWRASAALCQPWWSDLFKCYVLTGLRRSLMIDMRFEQIDFQRGIYLIDPHRRGTKRRGSNVPENAPPIELPLSKAVLGILRARREFAPDPAGWVWYTSRPQRGARTKEDSRLADPRSAWLYIEESIDGLHFGAQDLRRTFATLGGARASDIFALSLLMLHSPVSVAKEVGIPSITVDYINTAEAQDKMRAVAEEISAYVQKLVDDVERKLKVVEPVLPAHLEAALKAESDSERDSEDELEDGDDEDGRK